MFWYCDIKDAGFEGLFDSREKAYKAIKEFFTSFEEFDNVNVNISFEKDYHGDEENGIEAPIIDMITIKFWEENGKKWTEYYDLIGLNLNTSYIY